MDLNVGEARIITRCRERQKLSILTVRNDVGFPKGAGSIKCAA
jgi:hypothetical protein